MDIKPEDHEIYIDKGTMITCKTKVSDFFTTIKDCPLTYETRLGPTLNTNGLRATISDDGDLTL